MTELWWLLPFSYPKLIGPIIIADRMFFQLGIDNIQLIFGKYLFEIGEELTFFEADVIIDKISKAGENNFISFIIEA